MIKEYLIERDNVLRKRIQVNKEKIEHNRIAIVELKKQIEELENSSDEASQIFSVKAREDNGYKKQEIEELENKIISYSGENREFERIVAESEKELKIVRDSAGELDDYVSRETLNQKQDRNEQLTFNDIDEGQKDFFEDFQKAEIIEKLKLCKEIAELDGKRVKIEIDNLIKMIKE